MEKSRNLTLFGKIVIIKTLAIPKITYIATNCIFTDLIIKQISRMIYNFIWGSKDRIKRNVLISPIENGGVKMLDVESHFLALKASWVDRILNGINCGWVYMAKLNILPFIQCVRNMTFSNLESLPQINKIPPFYGQVLYAYAKSQYKPHPSNKEDILEQFIWGNRYIQFCNSKGKYLVLYFPSFISEGILRVRDLTFKNGAVDEHFLYNKIKNKKDIYREVFLLKQALKPYKNLLGNHDATNSENENVEAITTTAKTKTYYYWLIDQKCEVPKLQDKLSKKFTNYNIDFKLVYITKIKNINDLKIAAFNYKILHNILPCNKNLKLWGKRTDDVCDVCGLVQDVFHLIYECEFNKCIWIITSNVLGHDLTIEDVIIGHRRLGNVDHFITSIFLFYIYKYWLQCSNENKKRTWKGIRIFFIQELNYCKEIYKVTKLIGYCETIGLLKTRFTHLT